MCSQVPRSWFKNMGDILPGYYVSLWIGDGWWQIDGFSRVIAGKPAGTWINCGLAPAPPDREKTALFQAHLVTTLYIRDRLTINESRINFSAPFTVPLAYFRLALNANGLDVAVIDLFCSLFASSFFYRNIVWKSYC